MKCPIYLRIGLMLGIFSMNTMALFAGDRPPQSTADRPFATLFLSSLVKFRSACELIFDSVERPELYDSMDSRLKRYNDFAGIDPEKALGIMFTWTPDSTPHIVFLPVLDIEDLMTTATFGVVGFQKVSRDQYQMGRPEKPYHVLVRKDYALMAESLSTIQALRATPDQITRRMREQYDLTLHFDLRQIPLSDKRQMVSMLKKTIEPMLQTGDDETAESGRFRRTAGGLLLNLIERATMDTSTVTIGTRLAADTGQLHVEMVVDAVPKSSLAKACNQCSSRKSPFSAFLRSDGDAAAVAVMNVPNVRGVIQQVLGISDIPSTTDSRLAAVMQLVGERSGKLSLLGAFHGADMTSLNEAIPGLLSRTDESGQIARVDQNFNSFLGVKMHSLIPHHAPPAILDWIGSGPEVLLGQKDDTVWFGIGSSTNLVDQLEDAIQFADESQAERASTPILQAQIKGRRLPELVASNSIIPNMDARRVREELARGDDNIEIKVEAIADGIRMTIDFEEGFIRLIGRDWIRQIETFYRE